ncbi:hypothetical protein MBLNU457_g2488t1 [Dothideomycetes sp. NU457]
MSSAQQVPPVKRQASQESFEARQRRTRAARILESYEQLVWYSMTRNESLTQTRHHFQAIASGFKIGDEPSTVRFDSSPRADAYKSSTDLRDEANGKVKEKRGKRKSGATG